MQTLFSAQEAAVWGGFIDTHQRISNLLDHDLRHDSGLTRSEFDVLIYLSDAEDGRLRLQDLTDASGLGQSGISRLVSRLDEAGYAERIDAERDKRGCYAAITDRGRDHVDKAARRRCARVREMFLDHLDNDEKNTLIALWERIGRDTDEA